MARLRRIAVVISALRVLALDEHVFGSNRTIMFCANTSKFPRRCTRIALAVSGKKLLPTFDAHQFSMHVFLRGRLLAKTSRFGVPDGGEEETCILDSFPTLNETDNGESVQVSEDASKPSTSCKPPALLSFCALSRRTCVEVGERRVSMVKTTNHSAGEPRYSSKVTCRSYIFCAASTPTYRICHGSYE